TDTAHRYAARQRPPARSDAPEGGTAGPDDRSEAVAKSSQPHSARPDTRHAPDLPSFGGRCRRPHFWRWARSSAGEHYLDMVGVTGSIPVAPTIARPQPLELRFLFSLFTRVRARGLLRAAYARCRCRLQPQRDAEARRPRRQGQGRGHGLPRAWPVV